MHVIKFHKFFPKRKVALKFEKFREVQWKVFIRLHTVQPMEYIALELPYSDLSSWGYWVQQ